MRIIFHVGLHKTATTWLQSMLFKEHPAIHLINDYKEPWNDEVVRYLVLNDHYSFDRVHFRSMVEERIKTKNLLPDDVYLISAERLSGHPVSGGYDREKIIRNIHAAYPDSKILVTIRNQVDVIRSTYQQLVREGDTHKINDLLSQDCWKRPCFEFGYYDYEKLYHLYGELFAQSNVGFFFFEDLVENKEKFIKQLCAFLGVPEFVPQEVDKVNVSIGKKELEAVRILNHFRKNEYMPSPILNLRDGLLYKVLVKLLTLFVMKSDNDLLQEDVLHIKNYYKKSNLAFLSRLGDERNKDPRYVVENDL